MRALTSGGFIFDKLIHKKKLEETNKWKFDDLKFADKLAEF